ncbi:MAG: adenine-specific DNA-methyltransferase [Candidatus Paceibacteria bacterium]|jgi:adenine-specific DNA-methyltransferase
MGEPRLEFFARARTVPPMRRAHLRLQTSTLWYYPSQQYSDEPMGMPGYEGRTPAWVIWNLLERYTREGDRILDPFCGGGTTLDVARSMAREARGFDISPARDDIEKGDARKLPLEDESADFIFMDPPYSNHVEYSDEPDCIGRLDAFEEEYFEAMELVFDEADRLLKDRRYMAVFVGDSFKKKVGFVPIGARFLVSLCKRFKAVDHISIVRGNRKLEAPNFHKAAAEGNFYLRGFNHLMIFKKERGPRQ